MIMADDNARPDSNRRVYVNFDDFCLRKTEPPVAWCCPGENLIRNGDFEAGNTGFTSQYTFNGATTAWATLPGQYNIVTGAQALAISSGWEAQDPGTCNNASGKFMAVNGATTGSGRRVIWEQTVPVKEWGRYKFCVYAKNLKQCDFDVKPKVDIEFSLPFGNLSETLDVNTGGACGWYEFKKGLDNWGYGNSLTIKIFLHESQPGDGNDLALDDIALIEIPKMDIQYAYFNYSTPTSVGPNLWNITFNSSVPLPPGCHAAWRVKAKEIQTGNEHDIYNDPNWWASPTYINTTNFPGYNGTTIPTTVTSGTTPGVFNLLAFSYRITRGVYCECEAWEEWSIILNPSANRRNVEIRDEKTNKLLRSIRIR